MLCVSPTHVCSHVHFSSAYCGTHSQLLAPIYTLPCACCGAHAHMLASMCTLTHAVCAHMLAPMCILTHVIHGTCAYMFAPTDTFPCAYCGTHACCHMCCLACMLWHTCECQRQFVAAGSAPLFTKLSCQPRNPALDGLI